MVLVRYLLAVVDNVHLADFHGSTQTGYLEVQLIHFFVEALLLRLQENGFLNLVEANDDVTILVSEKLNARDVDIAYLPLYFPKLLTYLLGVN